MSTPVQTTANGARTEHYGQHGPDCFGCKLKTLRFSGAITQLPTHQHNGDPWDGNPVMERIHELQAQGRKVAAMEITNPNQTPETEQ